jgi:hemerythrin
MIEQEIFNPAPQGGRGVTDITLDTTAADASPLIVWTPEFELGDERLDDQHRQLVDIMNKFDAAVLQGRGRRLTDDLLNDLLGYSQEHFADEERLMEQRGYHGLDRHRALHRQLVQKLERFHFEFQRGERRLTRDMRELLRSWLTSHLLHEDRDFVAATAGVAGPAADG